MLAVLLEEELHLERFVNCADIAALAAVSRNIYRARTADMDVSWEIVGWVALRTRISHIAQAATQR